MSFDRLKINSADSLEILCAQNYRVHGQFISGSAPFSESLLKLSLHFDLCCVLRSEIITKNLIAVVIHSDLIHWSLDIIRVFLLFRHTTIVKINIGCICLYLGAFSLYKQRRIILLLANFTWLLFPRFNQRHNNRTLTFVQGFLLTGGWLGRHLLTSNI